MGAIAIPIVVGAAKAASWGWRLYRLYQAGRAAQTLMESRKHLEEAEKKSEELSEEDVEECTSDCGNGDKGKRQEERKKEIEAEADVKQQTKGKTRHGEKDGGMDEASGDFDSLEPSDVKDIQTQYGPGRTGRLEDGQTVTVRPGSSDGRPTLEIRNPQNGRGSEIRYNFPGS